MSKTPKHTLKAIELEARYQAIREALVKHDGDRTAAAAELGVSRAQFYRYLAGMKTKPLSRGRREDGRFVGDDL